LFIFNHLHRSLIFGLAINFFPNARLQRKTQPWVFCRVFFAERANATWLARELQEKSELHHFAVNAYCVMPDHVHALIQGMEVTSDLFVFVERFKQKTAYEFRKKFRCGLWQKKFYDHILRSDDPTESVALFIWMNPVRAGLCAEPQGYLFSGSFVRDWKKLISPAKLGQPSWKSKAPSESWLVPFDPALRDLRMNRAVLRFTKSKPGPTPGHTGGGAPRAGRASREGPRIFATRTGLGLCAALRGRRVQRSSPWCVANRYG
jgi:putative transposase